MKSFNDWTREIAHKINTEPHPPIDAEVAAYNEGVDEFNGWVYPCCRCGNLIRIMEFVDVWDFNPDGAYCGASPACVP